jgi:hypothetical protein
MAIKELGVIGRKDLLLLELDANLGSEGEIGSGQSPTRNR